MENLDSTIIATALPQIARAMNEDPLHLSLAITAYLLSLAVFIPLSGWVADRYGARRVFRAAILVFTLGSALCGISQSMPQLVGARILQGIGGAMMVDRKSTRLNSSPYCAPRMPSSAWKKKQDTTRQPDTP